MDKRVEEFKDFVRKYPGLKSVVRNGQATWQSLFEEWYLYGEDDGQWEKYKKAKPSEAKDSSDDKKKAPSGSKDSKSKEKAKDDKEKTDSAGILPNISGTEMVTHAINYIQKMDMNKVQQTMGTVQQFIQIFQTMQGPKAPGPSPGQKQSFPGLFSKYDD